MKKLLLSLITLCVCVGVRADIIKQNSNYHKMILMTQSVDHVTGATGLTLTITESKAGSAFVGATPTVTERGNGWYDILLTNTDDNTLGAFAMHITGSAADATDSSDQIVAVDLNDASLLGLTGVATLANQTALNTKIGTPAGASVSADIAAVQTTSTANSTSLGTLTTRIPQALLFDASGYLKSGVWAYNTGLDPASSVLNATATSYNTALTIGNKINASGSSGDPWSTLLPGGYASGTAGYILSHKLPVTLNATDVTGNLPSIVNTYASGQDPATLLNTLNVDGSLNWKQYQALQLSIALDGTRTFNSTSHVAVLTYYRRQAGLTSPDLTKPILTKTTTYDSTNTQVLSQTISLTNLP